MMTEGLEQIKTQFTGFEHSLLVLVGESGAGKSTLCRFMDCPDLWYSSSGTIVRQLENANIPVSHDSIHQFANQAYTENPEWQVPSILGAMEQKRVLVLDGPRRLLEVQALRRECPSMAILRIQADQEERYKRLQLRDNIDRVAFERVLSDESRETQLGQLLLMANGVISNNGTLEDIQGRAQEIRNLIFNL